MSPELREALLALFLVFTIATLYFGGSYKGTDSYMERGRVGSVDDLEVMIVTDTAAGLAMVRLAFYPYQVSTSYVVITPSQARALAELLRLAASPGRTLEEARFNQRHGGHSSVASEG